MNKIENFKKTLEKVMQNDAQSPQKTLDLINFFHEAQNVDINQLSDSEKEKIFLLHNDLSTSHDLTNQALVKAVHAFQKILNKPLPSNTKEEAKEELSSWKGSSDQNRAEAFRRINTTLKDLKKAEDLSSSPCLDLSDLELETLPSILFTDPRFIDMDIKVNTSKIRCLPVSLTIGSLLNIRLYEQFPQTSALTKLATIGDKGRGGPLQHIMDYLPTDTLAALSETSKASLPLLQEYTSEIVIDSKEKLLSFLTSLERSKGTWPSLTNLSITGELGFTDPELKLIVEKCPNLQALDLNGCNQITDVGLGHLSPLTKLQELYLDGCNQITDTGLGYLSCLTNLQYLGLMDCNQITDAGLGYLSCLTNLQVLGLGGCNQITDAGLGHLSPLTKLQELYLDGCNQITDAGLRPLSRFTNLRHLGLGRCNQITDAGLGHLSLLTKLQYLELKDCNQITDAGLGYLSRLTNLRYLGLGGSNQITDKGLGYLSLLTKLQYLELKDCNQITDAGLGHLSLLTKLEELYLSLCHQITDKGLGHLSRFTRLQILSLDGCYQITDTGLEFLSCFTRLQVLGLGRCNQITDTGLRHLSPLTKLQKLYLSLCHKITGQGLTPLSLLPNLQVLDLGQCHNITDTGRKKLNAQRLQRGLPPITF